VDETVSAALGRLATLARELGAERVAREVVDVSERLRDGRFYVVCVGQFKRGKSTLLNALVGEAIIPTGIIPVTSVVTVVRHGTSTGARVRLSGGHWIECGVDDLSAYVSEEQNPGNQKGVIGAEVFSPSPLLASGLCLVDTPGLGSVSVANSEATRAFVPHVDAALIVLGVDPPIAGEEATLVREMAAQTSILLVVLNKADRHTEGDRNQALHFSEQVLGEILGRVPHIFQVSAMEALAGRNTWDWEALVRTLRDVAVTSRSGLLDNAARRSVARLSGQLLDEMDHERTALLEPIAQSDARIARFEPLRSGADEVLQDLGHRLAGVEERLRKAFSEERDRFFRAALRDCAQEVRARVMADPATGVPSRERAYDMAREIALRRLQAWKTDVEPRAEQLYHDAVRRFVDFANSIQENLTASGVTVGGSLGIETGFTTASGYYPTGLMHLTASNLYARIVDGVLPGAYRRRAAAKDAVRYVERVLEVNSARVSNDFIERVTASRRALEREVREKLQELAMSAGRAVARARATKEDGLTAVAARVSWLDERREELQTLRQTALRKS
jgi:GTP-binding protein EngB required for normal cell division